DLLELKKLRLIACILRIFPCTSGRLGIKLKVGKKLRLFIMDSGDFMSVRK
ncbi:1336_t:CDS:1, partial [Acaulospora morrowiae]